MSIASLRAHALPPVDDGARTYGWAVPSAPVSPDRLRAVPSIIAAPRRQAGSTVPGLPGTVAANLGVPTVQRTVVDHAHLDHAASTPPLVSVKTAVDTALRTYSSASSATSYTGQITAGWFAEARTEIAAFVGARQQDEVVFAHDGADALRLLARTLPQRATVIDLTVDDEPGPWDPRRTLRPPLPGSIQDALLLLTDTLRHTPAGPCLVVVPGTVALTGEVWPVEAIVALAHDYGARVVLDAAQLVPHREVDVETLDLDYVTFSGDRLYAPFGTGVLVGRPDWLTHAAAYRHGSPNVVGAIALAAACAALTRARPLILDHENTLARRLRDGLGGIEDVATYAVFGDGHDRLGQQAFTIDGLDSSLVAAVLSAEYGIGAGVHPVSTDLRGRDRFEDDLDSSADPTADRTADPESTAVRVSLGLATTSEHIERLLRAVATLASTGPAFGYEHTANGWVPVDDPRDLTLPRPW